MARIENRTTTALFGHSGAAPPDDRHQYLSVHHWLHSKFCFWLGSSTSLGGFFIKKCAVAGRAGWGRAYSICGPCVMHMVFVVMEMLQLV